MKWDPYTLVVVLGKDGKADGKLYIDDGESYDFEQGAFIHRHFVVADGKLSSEEVIVSESTKNKKKSAFLKTMSGVKVERIIIVNAPESLDGKTELPIGGEGVKSGSTTQVSYHAAAKGNAAWALIGNPALQVGLDWTIELASATDAKTEL